MDLTAFSEHLEHPVGLGRMPDEGFSGAAGGSACGDIVRVDVAVDGERVVAAGFEAHGCGAMVAAGSAAVTLVQGASLLDAARVGTKEVSAELGGLSAGKVHAAELTADALHRALGAAVRHRAALSTASGRTLVALSGGVDSAVAALLVDREGGDVVAVTLELWADEGHDGERSCCSAQAVRRARALAHGMGLAHFTIDLRDEFRAGVVGPYLAAHAAGQTPNPCVRCNGHVRLDAMIELAGRLGAPRLATGHYARVVDDEDGPLLRAAVDGVKDQSYMLAALAPESLARLRFPLGELTKPEVRVLAREAELPVASAPESQDLCFLAGTRRDAFLARHGGLRAREGDIVDRAGKRVGRHRGHHAFTVGQRRGLGVGGGSPLYVLATDAATNRVVVGPREALTTQRVALVDVVLRRRGERVNAVKLRYRGRPLSCRIAGPAPIGAHASLELELSEPAGAGAPGQVACLMSGDVVVGWATIIAHSCTGVAAP
ncbi:MAG: tRNA 2-thiouridine(34) synthase MnmA [Solirubrobacteraceae bacterium]